MGENNISMQTDNLSIYHFSLQLLKVDKIGSYIIIKYIILLKKEYLKKML